MPSVNVTIGEETQFKVDEEGCLAISFPQEQ